MRLRLVLRLIGVWVGSLAIFAAVLAFLDRLKSSGVREAPWGIHLVTIASLPVVTLALLVCLVFPRSILTHPIAWTMATVCMISIVAHSVGGVVGLIFSVMVLIPASALFLISARWWPMET